MATSCPFLGCTARQLVSYQRKLKHLELVHSTAGTFKCFSSACIFTCCKVEELRHHLTVHHARYRYIFAEIYTGQFFQFMTKTTLQSNNASVTSDNATILCHWELRQLDSSLFIYFYMNQGCRSRIRPFWLEMEPDQKNGSGAVVWSCSRAVFLVRLRRLLLLLLLLLLTGL